MSMVLSKYTTAFRAICASILGLVLAYWPECSCLFHFILEHGLALIPLVSVQLASLQIAVCQAAGAPQ